MFWFGVPETPRLGLFSLVIKSQRQTHFYTACSGDNMNFFQSTKSIKARKRKQRDRDRNEEIQVHFPPSLHQAAKGKIGSFPYFLLKRKQEGNNPVGETFNRSNLNKALHCSPTSYCTYRGFILFVLVSGISRSFVSLFCLCFHFPDVIFHRTWS